MKTIDPNKKQQWERTKTMEVEEIPMPKRSSTTKQYKPIYQWVADVHKQACEKGWWDDNQTVKPKRPLEIHALIVSEVAEAMEEFRKGMPPIYSRNETVRTVVDGKEQVSTLPGKPEGELIELADAVIRIMDYCGRQGWDLEAAIKMKFEFNATRPYRHGNKQA